MRRREWRRGLDLSPQLDGPDADRTCVNRSHSPPRADWQGAAKIGIISTMSLTGKIGWSLAFWIVLMVASARTWAANPASCANDIDCTATPACGGDVCTYTATGSPTCTPAGTGSKGSDGWCTVDSDCKCFAEGARCSGVFCTFTKAGDAPGAGGKGGGSGVAGTSGGAGGAAGGSHGPAADAGTPPPSNSGGGGCNVAGEQPAAGGALLLAALGFFALLARRRFARRS
jgi:MYXO-CTERM domain-containing protein